MKDHQQLEPLVQRLEHDIDDLNSQYPKSKSKQAEQAAECASHLHVSNVEQRGAAGRKRACARVRVLRL